MSYKDTVKQIMEDLDDLISDLIADDKQDTEAFTHLDEAYTNLEDAKKAL